jgi:hypothetical protein
MHATTGCFPEEIIPYDLKKRDIYIYNQRYLPNAKAPSPEDLDPTWIPYIRDINSYEIRRKNAWLRRSEDVLTVKSFLIEVRIHVAFLLRQ